jgi:N-acetylneuraminate synthase
MTHDEPTLIAEIGCNHKGDLALAKEMVMVAKLFCQVTSVKFQKRNPRELLTPEEYNAPHPEPYHSYGKTYGEHREFLEFNVDQHRELKAYCDEFGVVYSTSVWDMLSTRQMVEINPTQIKVPSAANLRIDILQYLADHFAGEIHISLGMTRREEEDRILKFMEKSGRSRDVVLYACTSGYPVSFEDVCLLEISRLKAMYGPHVKGIGFSGHHLGFALDPVAYSLGAQYIERHFTLDRTWKGTDNAASLEPDGMRRLARDLKAAAKALTYKETEVLPVEAEQRKKLKRIPLPSVPQVSEPATESLVAMASALSDVETETIAVFRR